MTSKMTAKLLDGRQIAHKQNAEIAHKVQGLITQGKRPPGLAVILIGTDPASALYVRKKREACEAVGFYSQAYHFPNTVQADTLFELISTLNQSANIDGILLQLPLPAHLPEKTLIEHISPQKDVDGFHPLNLGKLAQNKPGLRPCTPLGIMRLLAQTDLELTGCRACVVGASNIVGRPVALELLNQNATVTICQIHTRELVQHIQHADLLVVAIGKPNFIQGDWLKPGTVVIDVGINRLANGKIVGDVDFNSAKEKASWITPVPGGVGPMTVSSLLQNTLSAALDYNKL